MIEKTVPEIILDQLGGNRFLVMTGCHHLLGDKKSLQMKIPRNASRANYLKITLEPDDTYRMEFWRYRDEYQPLKKQAEPSRLRLFCFVFVFLLWWFHALAHHPFFDGLPQITGD